VSEIKRDKSLERLKVLRDKWIGKEVFHIKQPQEGVWKVRTISEDVVPYSESIDGITMIPKFGVEFVAYIYKKDKESRILGRQKEIRTTLDNLLLVEEMNELVRELCDI
jgi:hypothetical protein